MRPDTWPFLEALFGQYTLPEPAYLTFTAIQPGGHFPTPSRHARWDDTQHITTALTDLLRANQLGWGAYVAVAFRRANLGRWQRGGKADLVGLPALFVDIDDKVAGLTRLEGFDPQPSCVIDSGHGIHGYWFLETPLTDLRLADNVLRGLAQFLEGDSRMSSAQSLRLPGSINTKPTRQGARCEVIELSPKRRYAPLDFAAFMRTPSSTRRAHQRAEVSRFPIVSRVLNPALIEAVVERLIGGFDGYFKPNGYLAALCPCGHGCDQPGQHFNFDASRAIGTCFGRHGRLLLKDLCDWLGIHPSVYGGLFAS